MRRELSQGYPQPAPGGRAFAFLRNWRGAPSSIVHFQVGVCVCGRLWGGGLQPCTPLCCWMVVLAAAAALLLSPLPAGVLALRPPAATQPRLLPQPGTPNPQLPTPNPQTPQLRNLLWALTPHELLTVNASAVSHFSTVTRAATEVLNLRGLPKGPRLPGIGRVQVGRAGRGGAVWARAGGGAGRGIVLPALSTAPPQVPNPNLPAPRLPLPQ